MDLLPSRIEDPSDGNCFYPDKYAAYFASMSPLAARVIRDIKQAEQRCDNFASLSYDEKCSVIDKDLGPIKTGENKESEVSHTLALLTAVMPKKPEEFLYNGGNESWLDDDDPAKRFNGYVESRFSACNLKEMFKKASISAKKKQRGSSTRKVKGPAPQPVLSPVSPTVPVSDDDSKSKRPFGLCSSSEIASQRGYKPLPKGSVREFERSDDVLPNQRQNLDLIAELQAKLKKTKPEERLQNIVKPKAPPPPPPPHVSNPSGNGSNKPVASPKVSSKASNLDEFVVDVSSPCKIATPKTGFDFLDNW